MIITSTLTFSSNVVFLVTSDEKLSLKASNQLPEFFQEEFPTFQKFIELYYKFQNDSREGYKNIESIKDIDEIGQKYLEAFHRTYAKDMPVFPYIGIADFIRNAKHFYTSRGSEESFRFLFRIMFGIEIDFKYPKENLLIPSSGLWNQKVSIYINVLDGVVDDYLIGRKLRVKSIEGTTTNLMVKGLTHLYGTYWEVEVDKFVQQQINVGDRIFAKQDPITLEYKLTCKVVSTLNSFEVLNPGADFKLGEIHDVTTPAGTLKYRITAIDKITGALKRIEFLEFGNVYASDFTFTLNDAQIKLKPTSVNRYFGFYENTDGFISDNNKIHDGYFYQIFSYVIKSVVSRELYEDLVLKILHPSGLIMFSEYEQSATYEMNPTFESEYKRFLDIIDSINNYDEFYRLLNAKRTFNDTIEFQESVSKKMKKFFSDTTNLTDQGSLIHYEGGDYVELGYTISTLYTTAGVHPQTF